MVAGLPGRNGPPAATAVAVDGRSAPGPAPTQPLSMAAPFVKGSPPRSFPVPPCAQWMEPGLNGANGQPAARSAPTGEAESVWPRRRKTVAKTAAGCFSIPKTAPMGSVCKIRDL
ncbi:hypothetical protein JRQ81_017253 [Phrynocephalus forsythii]|uniref:Uncharacterized protein n=1 Tax=Phrynocephalus forsythii TaxID=171643 RepID=A0A9Q0XR04_9SAUR|nr:hypothetical protein JRQ81_017253 [Phrynocephalus forsythii]